MAGSAATLRLAAAKYAALYIRVSTTDQGERYSPAIQKAKGLEKARNDGYQVRPEHIFIDMHTGKETARPAFEKLRALVKSGAVQGVIVLSVCRLARKAMDAAIIKAEFKRHGADIDFVEMSNDDSPEGRFMFTAMAGMAEYMGEKIVQKGREGHDDMRKQGPIPGRVPMFGHDRHPAEKGKRVINKAEQAVLLKMFQMADSMTSTYAIAAWLNAEGIRGKGRNGLEPAEWSNRTAQQALTNRAAIGEHYDGGVLIEVPRLIPDDLFYRVQAKLEQTRLQRVGRKPTESLLVNYLFCECSPETSRMTIKRNGTNGKYRSYGCNAKTNKPPIRHLCTAPVKQYKADPVERCAWGLIWPMLKQPAVLLSQAEAWLRAQPKPKSSTSMAALERELATAKRAYQNIIKRCDQGHGSFEEEKPKLDGLKRRIAQIEAEVRAIAPVLELPAEARLKAALNEITPEDEPTTFTERRDILEGLEDLHIVNRGGFLTITGKVPVGLPSARVTNCDSSQGRDPNYRLSIPFILEGRVA